MTIAVKNILTPVSKNRLHIEIVDQIQRKILTGELTPGTKLPTERELALELNVNRATVREALKKLEILGLIVINHGDGIYVLDYLESGNLELLKSFIYLEKIMPLDIMKNLLEMRKIMAPEMAAAAAERRTDEDADRMEAAINSTSKGIAEKDLDVQRIIARAGGNILYIFILNFFNQIFRDYGDIYFSDPENVRVTEKYHAEICRAFRNKNAQRSKKVTDDVLEYTEKRIISAYEKFNNRGIV